MINGMMMVGKPAGKAITFTVSSTFHREGSAGTAVCKILKCSAPLSLEVVNSGMSFQGYFDGRSVFDSEETHQTIITFNREFSLFEGFGWVDNMDAFNPSKISIKWSCNGKSNILPFYPLLQPLYWYYENSLFTPPNIFLY